MVNPEDKVHKFSELNNYTITSDTGGTTISATNEYITDGQQVRLDGINHGSDDSTWTDLSGNNINGTTNNGIWGDKYLEFNGSSTWVNLGQMNSDYKTLEATFSTDVVPTSEVDIISNYQSGGSGIDMNSEGYILGEFYVNGSYYNVASTEKVEIGKIYHVITTYDGRNIVLYINGEKVGTTSVSGVIGSPLNSTVMALGTNPNASASVDCFLDGKIYGVAVYNRALTEDEIITNYNVSYSRYINKSNNMFDSNTSTVWTSNSEENSVTINLGEEKTITGFRIYGSESNYPTNVELLGSKDGEEYTSITNSTLETKGLDEYNEIIIDEDNYDSYKYLKFVFTGSTSAVSIGEIETEIYNIKREVATKLIGDSVELTTSNFTYKADCSSYCTMYESNGAINSYFSNSGGMSSTYYNNVITVEKTTSVEGTLGIQQNWSNETGGAAYVGFATSPDATTDDFISYEKYEITSKSEVKKDFSVSVAEPGEYYFKIILYHNINSNGATVYGTVYGNLYSLSINKNAKPVLKEATLKEATQTGNITSTTGSVIYNEDNANLVLDKMILNINKA